MLHNPRLELCAPSVLFTSINFSHFIFVPLVSTAELQYWHSFLGSTQFFFLNTFHNFVVHTMGLYSCPSSNNKDISLRSAAPEFQQNQVTSFFSLQYWFGLDMIEPAIMLQGRRRKRKSLSSIPTHLIINCWPPGFEFFT